MTRQYNSSDLVIIIPCKNESDNLAGVIAKLKELSPKAIIIGVDPTTTDDTEKVANDLGCVTVNGDRSGYDPVVAASTEIAVAKYPDSVLMYADAGNKYDYAYGLKMLDKINDGADMVMAVRVDSGSSMLWHQKLGTKLVLVLINLSTKSSMRDISPFRLVKSSIFSKIKMDPQKFRWPSELLVKALAIDLKVDQLDVVSLPRTGTSKVSGSIKNSARAGLEMISSLKFINYKGAK
jgi:glycosyltransferase involved in cell wall biosynthesis